jgi:hypothetical protein
MRKTGMKKIKKKHKMRHLADLPTNLSPNEIIKMALEKNISLYCEGPDGSMIEIPREKLKELLTKDTVIVTITPEIKSN